MRLKRIDLSLTMSTVTNKNINILDLPDEMLRVIFDKLHMIDVFYSLVDVNHRFDRLALDSLYVLHLDFVIKPLFDRNSPVDDQLLYRIYTKILPRIRHKVNKITVEPLSIERVLGAVHYPQLHSISFVNFHYGTLLEHLQGLIIILCNIMND